jgi:misacylated tRNA(Ala) deacylase
MAVTVGQTEMAGRQLYASTARPNGEKMATYLRFLEDAYQTETAAMILRSDHRGLVLDQTVFYPATGISPADQGEIIFSDGEIIPIVDAIWERNTPNTLLHVAERSTDYRLPATPVKIRIFWPARYRCMRVHTALRIVSIALPYPVIGGFVRNGGGFVTIKTDDLKIPLKRLTRLSQELANRNLPVDAIWIEKPLHDPRARHGCFDWSRGAGRVRAIRVGELNTTPCDGLHVRNTSEIGVIEVTEIRRRSPTQLDVHIMVTDYSALQS